MPVIKAIIEYDGTDFDGFQKQPSRRTVQGELERAIGVIFREELPKIIGAGRTDAGVHATGQVVSFSAPDWFPVDRIRVAMNSLLPVDVRVRSATEVPEGFHARYSAKSRKYVYTVLNRDTPSALLARYTWYVARPLDVNAMRAAASKLIGTQDFASFGMPDKPGRRTIRTVLGIRIRRHRDVVYIVIKANAFLRGMARAMVGTLVDIGRERRRSEEIVDILAAGNRQAVRVIAPPRGLYLTEVEYK